MKRRSIIVSLAASVALVIAVAAVSASKQHDRQASGTQVAAPTRGEGGVGSTVGRFTTTDIDGRTLTVPAVPTTALLRKVARP